MLDEMNWWGGLRGEGHGKAAGSFTEQVREQFEDWLKERNLSYLSAITFEYRLYYRRKTITVAISHIHIFHNRLAGDGSKGFVLDGRVLAIDGAPPSGEARHYQFALNRIVGRFQRELLALTTVSEEIS